MGRSIQVVQVLFSRHKPWREMMTSRLAAWRQSDKSKYLYLVVVVNTECHRWKRRPKDSWSSSSGRRGRRGRAGWLGSVSFLANGFALGRSRRNTCTKRGGRGMGHGHWAIGHGNGNGNGNGNGEGMPTPMQPAVQIPASPPLSFSLFLGLFVGACEPGAG